MRKQLVKIYIIFSFLVSLGFVTCSYSQITISTPSIGFTQACASPSFNNYTFSFSFFPAANLGAGNQFIIEMSDTSGSFAAPVTLTTLTNTTSPVSGSFAIPVTANGSGYRIRVRSTNPVKISPSSAPFAAYYAVHNQPYSINGNIGTVNLCQGDSYTLSIDDLGTPASPVYYPELTYIWYKDYIEIPGETGPSITVMEAGSYYVVTNYGPCVMNSYSNIVQINVQAPLTPVIESAGGETTICPSDSIALTSQLQEAGYTYTWYKDDVALPASDNPVYNATEGGIYHLTITSGGCAFESNAITLDSTDFDLLLDPSPAVSIIPGETITLTAITDAVLPVIEWYKDDVLIPGATGLTHNITEPGNYKVIVTQPAPCNIVKEAVVDVSYPLGFDLAVQTSGYSSCSSTSVDLSILQFEATLLSGVVDLIGNTFGYTYQWYRNGVPVSGGTTTGLSINNPAENGSYELRITLLSYGTLVSNAIDINLGIQTPVISGNTVFCTGGNTLLSSDVTNPGYAYQWFQDNIAIPGANASIYTADAEGDYHLTVSSGSCMEQSNTLTVAEAAITVTSTDPVVDIILPGETKTLTVTTDAVAPQYSWTRDGAAISGSTSTLSATQDGEYIVTVTQTVGCGAVAQFTFVLEYPTGFDVTIAPDAGYTACTSTSTTLTITNFTADTPSGTVPMTDLGYSYQWFKDGVAVAGPTAQTLALTSAAQNGDYYLEVVMPDFAAIISNTVTINLAVEAVAISGDTALCEGGSVLLSSSLTAPEYTYQWFKDNIAIPGANTSTYTADAEGDYKIEVGNGTCNMQSNTLTVTTVSITVTSTDPLVDIILPGETKTLTVTTDAMGPEYSWTRDGAAIPGSTSTLSATQDGEYIVTVTQTVGCGAVAQFTFVLEYPTGFDVAIAPDAGYTACTSTSATLDIANFTADTPSGTVPMTDLDYTYQWFKDGVAVAGATAQTLALTSAAQNGDYHLEVTMPDFAAIISNTVTINLAVEAVAISGDTALCEGGTVVLSSNLTAPEYTYQWFKDNIAIPGANTSTYTASAEGDYKIEVGNGTCNMQSNTLTVTTVSITVNSTDPLVDIILPGEIKTLTVTTNAMGPEYSWTRDGVAIPGSTSTLSATQDGEYVVTVTQTVGCTAAEQMTFVLEYPTGFDVAIAPDAVYTACTSTSATLDITNFTADTPSGTVPMTDLGYTYQWFKDGAAVAGATAQTLNLTSAAQNGDYYLEVVMPDFAAIISNTVTINLAVEAVAISGDTALCEGGSVLLSSNLTAPEYTYQWFQDNVAIPGANTSTYTASAEGDYKIEVGNGTCNMQSNTLTVTTVSITVTSTDPLVDIILPGETKTLTVTTDAMGPQYSWTRDGAAIPGSTSTLSATQDGEYIVTVTQTIGCTATEQMTFVLGYPTGFTITIAPDAAYEPCVVTTATLDIASFIAITFSGNIPMTDLGYDYQWYLDGNPVPGATSSTLTVNDASQNGNYRLQVIMPGFSALLSNTVTVNLSVGTVDVVAAGQLCPENPQVEITSSVTDPSYTYEWFKDAVSVSTGNTPSFTVTEEGEYHVKVTTGTCSFISNILDIQQSDFSLTPDNPLTDVIIPGENKVISVTTDALSPVFEWYKDDVIIPGASAASLYANEDGVYKVVVTQTQDCSIVKELTYNLIYPTGFDIDVAASDEFTECSDVSAQLNISLFHALTPSGPIDILGNDYGYGYQWYHDGMPIAGAVSTTFNVIESGVYHLEVTVPDFGVIISNSVTINLGFVAEVTISTDDIFCASDSQITMTSNVNDDAYTYQWFKVGSTTVIGTANSIMVDEAASYFLEVTFENCTVASNVLEIIPYDMSQITLSSGPELDLPEGTTETIIAGGAESYVWYFNGVIVSNGPSVEVTQEGLYTVTATIGECEETRQVLVKLVENNVIAIPNAITLNNDGINDKWALPVKYVNKENVEIVIYGPDGTIVYRASNYTNNWPESDFTYSKKYPVYYYTIMEDNEITKRGSITIIE